MKPTHVFNKNGKRVKGQLLRTPADDPRLKRIPLSMPAAKAFYLSTSTTSITTSPIVQFGKTWLIQSAGPKAVLLDRRVVEQWPHSD